MIPMNSMRKKQKGKKFIPILPHILEKDVGFLSLLLTKKEKSHHSPTSSSVLEQEERWFGNKSDVTAPLGTQ